MYTINNLGDDLTIISKQEVKKNKKKLSNPDLIFPIFFILKCVELDEKYLAVYFIKS